MALVGLAPGKCMRPASQQACLTPLTSLLSALTAHNNKKTKLWVSTLSSSQYSLSRVGIGDAPALHILTWPATAPRATDSAAGRAAAAQCILRAS